MELSFLIPSKVRRQLLNYFVQYPDVQIHVRELARELELSPQQTYNELINLENWGFLFSSKRGNQRVFRVNQKFVFFNAIKDIFEIYETEQNREYKIDKVYNLNKMIKKLKNISAPKELTKDYKRSRPRAYEEHKMLEKND